MCNHNRGFIFTRELPKDAHPDLPGVFACIACPYWLNFNPETAGSWKVVGHTPHMDQWRSNTLCYKPYTGVEKKIELSTQGKY